ncbi:MAG: dipeptide epimerase [Cytophagaceae bacterium]|nr:dipeptide epimerase [Cytophagaceae bacterium]
MLNWDIQERKLDLKYNWKISRNESFHKINLFVEVSDGKYKGLGEIAPNIRYGETPELIKSQFENFKKLSGNIISLEELTTCLNEIQVCNSLRFGIESSYIDFFLQNTQQDFFSYFKINQPGKIFTSYTIPIIPPGDVKEFIGTHHLTRFKSLKIKVNTRGLDLIKEVAKYYKGFLIVDANEAWTDPDDHLKFMEKLKKYPIEFIEQPFPHTLFEEYVYLKSRSPFPVMGDESITNEADFNLLKQQFHGVNVKLMKAGSIVNGIKMLQEARRHNLLTMIGCMIETTLGISVGMKLCGLVDYADLDGFFVIDEEPFHLVEESNGELIFKK